jgi:hypothetical protein
MIALARQIVRRGVPILNLLFHSSEAIVGGSPYNRTDAELSAFFDRLGRLLRVATSELGAVPMTFAEFRAAFASGRAIEPGRPEAEHGRIFRPVG